MEIPDHSPIVKKIICARMYPISILPKSNKINYCRSLPLDCIGLLARWDMSMYSFKKTVRACHCKSLLNNQ